MVVRCFPMFLPILSYIFIHVHTFSRFLSVRHLFGGGFGREGKPWFFKLDVVETTASQMVVWPILLPFGYDIYMDLLQEPLKIYIHIFPIDSPSSGFPMEEKQIISKSKDMIQILCMYPRMLVWWNITNEKFDWLLVHRYSMSHRKFVTCVHPPFQIMKISLFSMTHTSANSISWMLEPTKNRNMCKPLKRPGTRN